MDYKITNIFTKANGRYVIESRLYEDKSRKIVFYENIKYSIPKKIIIADISVEEDNNYSIRSTDEAIIIIKMQNDKEIIDKIFYIPTGTFIFGEQDKLQEMYQLFMGVPFEGTYNDLSRTVLAKKLILK